MDQLPIWLTIENRDVLVVGGGGMAVAKARIAAIAGANVTFVAPSIGSEAKGL
ncbi:MAG: siroheme synthase, partial [Alphaproteobacteria bacterium]|nr:siroheme synthase [Alphaproteobacteria bacterium]